MKLMKDPKRWLAVVLYAIAMAWMESAVVFYLRALSELADRNHATVLPPVTGIRMVEMVREAATLIMLWAVGMLAGKTLRSRWGYAAIAFGVWDIFYYVFLRVICHWPGSLLEWDVLFLLPLPWWGPVLSPVLIALLMIVWGTLATQGEPFHRPVRSELKAWAFNFLGIAVALYVFMEDALHSGRAVVDATPSRPPSHFNWTLFMVALALMTAPIIHAGRQIVERAGSVLGLGNDETA